MPLSSPFLCNSLHAIPQIENHSRSSNAKSWAFSDSRGALCLAVHGWGHQPHEFVEFKFGKRLKVGLTACHTKNNMVFLLFENFIQCILSYSTPRSFSPNSSQIDLLSPPGPSLHVLSLLGESISQQPFYNVL